MKNRNFAGSGKWFGFGMALALVVNGLTTFTGPGWLWDISRVLIVVFGFGVLPAVLDQFTENKGWAIWATNLAYLGLAAEALRQLTGLEFTSVFLLFGGLAVWGLTVNILALRSNVWQNTLAWIGMASSLLLVGALIASRVPSLLWLDTVSAALGAVVLYPVWLIWMGTRVQTN